MILIKVNGISVYVKSGDVIETKKKGEGTTKLEGIEITSEDGQCNFIPKRKEAETPV